MLDIWELIKAKNSRWLHSNLNINDENMKTEVTNMARQILEGVGEEDNQRKGKRGKGKGGRAGVRDQGKGGRRGPGPQGRGPLEGIDRYWARA